ncbi:hypothetical protein C7293_01025 [filamentous cyanobacterium CCT1]|nr:hypothetical protein C7293_01025 [filamentous cyanobacterium CCT1]PSN80291.1 hypothetical protein C8B47_07255 [filamentous cyanobacterium CCP4]
MSLSGVAAGVGGPCIAHSRSTRLTILDFGLGILANGLWVLCNDHKYFMPYDQFPWFKDAPIKHIFNLEEPHPGHLYWPDLDIDLSLEIIQHPKRFPRIARAEA